ncbi:MAG: GAF domain-containing protein [Planctomycetes bacterium]|nr:GAF domain-containing protein [Planctomycetota bacterium]
MVGQAALQRKHIILTDVPDDYTAVSSGLGETPPRHILVWPIVHEDEVKAVIELGALEAFQDRGLDLLNQVTENIAIALEVAQSRRRLQDLLEQSRAQSESLQARTLALQAREGELKSSNSLPEWTRHATPSVGSQSATPL